MTTIEHTYMTLYALLLLAGGNIEEAMNALREEIPYVLLPDALRYYLGTRTPTHFEETVDAQETSWIVFPDDKTLKELSRENYSEKLTWHESPVIGNCVIGEPTSIEAFLLYNSGHKHVESLCTHLRQDKVLESVLADTMVDISARYKNSFVVRTAYGEKEIDGQTLRQEIAKFQMLAGLELAISLYEKYGILADSNWMEENVSSPLRGAYDPDLAKNTIKYMIIPDMMRERVLESRHVGRDEVSDMCTIRSLQNFQSIVKSMYTQAIEVSRKELEGVID